jgi:ubiquinone/menaquinone biosynthesis C-methylase UbiE
VAGKSGYSTLKEAFDFIEAGRKIFSQYSTEAFMPNVLDFGCGWGRLCQAWSTFTLPSRVLGCDVRPSMIEIAKNNAPMQNFIVCNPVSPLQIENQVFDIITAYSVFSHLSEEAANFWINEFYRLLKPGGMAFITTRSRAHLLQSKLNYQKLHATNEKELNHQNIFYASMLDSIEDFDNAIYQYDNGGFVYIPTGGGRGLERNFYGESIVPLSYVSKYWAKDFLLVDWIPSFSPHGYQPLIALRKI